MKFSVAGTVVVAVLAVSMAFAQQMAPTGVATPSYQRARAKTDAPSAAHTVAVTSHPRDKAKTDFQTKQYGYTRPQRAKSYYRAKMEAYHRHQLKTIKMHHLQKATWQHRQSPFKFNTSSLVLRDSATTGHGPTSQTGLHHRLELRPGFPVKSGINTLTLIGGK